jgi:hypothetical protein
MVPPPDQIQYLIKQLDSQSLPVHSSLSEEELSIQHFFAEEVDLKMIERQDGSFAPIPVQQPSEEIRFEAFLDGVQRTVLRWRFPLPGGALVPIHIAHIAAGVLLRTVDGRLFTEPDLIASRLLLLAPFQGLKEAGAKLDIPVNDPIWDVGPQTFSFPQDLNEWILCDTTFRSTQKDRETRFRDNNAITGNMLFDEGLIRSRAQGRAATLRQRLEFAILARFRGIHPDKWILVDGPLFFIDKWSAQAAEALRGELNREDGIFEDSLLAKAVGLIKSQRLRPKHPEHVMQIGVSERSPVALLSKEVDIKGSRETPDEVGNYSGLHLTWYTRLRGRNEPPYGFMGLIRLDIHRSTLPSVRRADALNQDNFREFTPLVDAITHAVWRERWPSFKRIDDYKTAAEPYPIQQIERLLKSVTLPRRLLAHITDFQHLY